MCGRELPIHILTGIWPAERRIRGPEYLLLPVRRCLPVRLGVGADLPPRANSGPHAQEESTDGAQLH